MAIVVAKGGIVGRGGRNELGEAGKQEAGEAGEAGGTDRQSFG